MNFPPDLEPELQEPSFSAYRPRITGTLLSRKPSAYSFLITLGLALLVSIISMYQWSQPSGWQEQWAVSNRKFWLHHEWPSLLTSLFLHSDPAHLLSNLGGFWVFGYFLYGYFGWILFPCLGVLIGALAEALTLWSYPPDTSLLGLSGTVYAMAGLWISLFMWIERRYSISSRMFRALGFVFIVLVPSEFDPKVSYLSHFWGFVLGALAGSLYFYVHKKKFRDAETVTLVANA